MSRLERMIRAWGQQWWSCLCQSFTCNFRERLRLSWLFLSAEPDLMCWHDWCLNSAFVKDMHMPAIFAGISVEPDPIGWQPGV